MGWFSDNPASFVNLAKGIFHDNHFNFQQLLTFIDESFDSDDPLNFSIRIHNDYRHYDYQTPYGTYVGASIGSSKYGWTFNLTENGNERVFTRDEFEQYIQYALDNQRQMPGGGMREIDHPADVYYEAGNETYKLVSPGEISLYLDNEGRIVLDGVFQTMRDAKQEDRHFWFPN